MIAKLHDREKEVCDMGDLKMTRVVRSQECEVDSDCLLNGIKLWLTADDATDATSLLQVQVTVPRSRSQGQFSRGGHA